MIALNPRRRASDGHCGAGKRKWVANRFWHNSAIAVCARAGVAAPAAMTTLHAVSAKRSSVASDTHDGTMSASYA